MNPQMAPDASTQVPPVRVGVVGYGWWGKTMARQIAMSPWLSLAAVAESHDTTRQGMAHDTALQGVAVVDSAQALMAHPGLEAVILCTPHEQHAQQIMAAAQAGLHVFCEKPLCLTLADARQAVDACGSRGLVLGIGHERRFEPEVVALRQMIADGVLGTILQIEANFSQDKFFALPKDNWRLSNRHAPVGPLTATGIHLVDLSIAVLGPCESLWARLATLGSDFENGDTLAVMMAFPQGANAMVSAVLATPFEGGVGGNPRPHAPGESHRLGHHRRPAGSRAPDALCRAGALGAAEPGGLRARRARRRTLPGVAHRDAGQRGRPGSGDALGAGPCAAGRRADMSEVIARPAARRLSAPEREARIVDEAVHFFAEVGFGGDTRELAKRLGVTQSLLYKYFPNKEALINRVFDVVYMGRWNPFWESVIHDRSVPLQERLTRLYLEYAKAALTRDWVRIFMFSGLRGESINSRYLTVLRQRILEPIAAELRHEFGLPDVAEVPLKSAEIELVWGINAREHFLAGARVVLPRLLQSNPDQPITSR